MNKKNGILKYSGIIILLMLIVNLFLSFITTVFNIAFEKPHDLIEVPEIFFSFKIYNYTLNINQTIVNTWVIMLIIIMILILGTRKISIDNPGFFQIILEEYYNFVLNSFVSGYGEYKKIFISFFSAMFSLILMINISIFLFPFIFMFKKIDGKIFIKPFFRTATADLNTTLGLALIVFVIFIIAAIYRMGILGFIKELSHPFIFMLPINIIGELAKPISICMRLFGNMFAGLIIMALIYGLSFDNLIPNLTGNILKGGFSLSVAWPNVLQIYLDFFIGIIQAYIFTILSSVYIKQMLIGEEE